MKNVYISTTDWFHGSILPFPRRLKCHDRILEVGIKQSMGYYFLLFDHAAILENASDKSLLTFCSQTFNISSYAVNFVAAPIQ